MCQGNKENLPVASFAVNGQTLCVIYDVPHLLKNTRNCLLKSRIEFRPGKVAKFGYIEKAFNLDKEKRSYTQLPKLKRCRFNFKDTYLKMKVNVAAAQLSRSVAACMETWVSMGLLPAEAMYTAEFSEMMDNLFDSLNSSGMIIKIPSKHVLHSTDLFQVYFHVQQRHTNVLSPIHQHIWSFGNRC